MTDPSWHIPDPDYQPEFYADVPLKRLLAWVVDLVIVFAAAILVLPFTAFTGLFFFPLLMLALGFAYRVITISRGSATWGMRLMAIEFRTVSGDRFDSTMAFAHTGLFTLACLISPLQLLSIILIAIDKRAQGLPDRMLGTVVLNRRAGQ
jgi:uncharacterized RDD family membrane protein YckC